MSKKRLHNSSTILLLLLALFLSKVSPDEHDHSYKDGEEVVLWMNTVCYLGYKIWRKPIHP
jgi:hypothetical protein